MIFLLLPAEQLLSINEGTGGLFDFNATLPLMAFQFTLLSVGLTLVFYKPALLILDKREAFIKDNLELASYYRKKSDWLYSKSEEQLKTARIFAQALIAQSEKEAKDVVASEITEVSRNSLKLIEKTNKVVAEQKTLALAQVESQVDDLSQLIEEALLGNKVA
jgi:F-type H+-transporting ATPase subunit b